jgi:translation initiation factor IF-3
LNHRTGQKAQRLNEEINAPEIRLDRGRGEQVGIVSVCQAALKMAEEAGVDLVEIAPLAKPPVCRIMDYRQVQVCKRRRKRTRRS